MWRQCGWRWGWRASLPGCLQAVALVRWVPYLRVRWPWGAAVRRECLRLPGALPVGWPPPWLQVAVVWLPGLQPERWAVAKFAAKPAAVPEAGRLRVAKPVVV